MACLRVYHLLFNASCSFQRLGNLAHSQCILHREKLKIRDLCMHNHCGSVIKVQEAIVHECSKSATKGEGLYIS